MNKGRKPLRSWRWPGRAGRGEQGSVSVLLILLLSAVLLLYGVLYDYARFRIAEKQIELAGRTALRSLMSAYDLQYRQYGLFASAVDDAEAASILAEVLQRYEGGDLALSPETHEAVYFLSDSLEFKRQILEDMKYRAPVNFILQAVDKWNPGESRAARTEQFAEKAEEVEVLIGRREETLDQAWKYAKELAETLLAAELRHSAELGRLQGLYERIAPYDRSEVSRQIRLLEAAVAQAEPDDRPALQGELSFYLGIQSDMNRYDADKSNAGHNAEQTYSRLLQLKGELEQKLAEAKRLNDDIRDMLEAATEASGNASAAEGGGEPEDGLEAEEVYQYVPLLEQQYFDQYRLDAAEIVSLFGGYRSLMIPFAGRYEDSFEALLRTAEHTNRFLLNRTQAEAERQESRGEVEQQKRTLKRQAREWVEQALKVVYACEDDAAEKEAYRLLGQYYRLYTASDHEGAQPASADGDVLEAGKSSIAMLGRLGDLMRGVRDELYMNEYALSYFNHRVSEQLPDQAAGMTRMQTNHTLKGQEAEYVLYGFHSCAANQSAAYGEMFAVRLAVRTAEALTKPEKGVVAAGSPILVLLFALAEGAGRAYADMQQLTAGKEVPVWGSGHSITMNYADYLRLFLLLHGSEQAKLARMQALLHLNTGRSLEQAVVYRQISVKGSYAPRFIPAALLANRQLHETEYGEGRGRGRVGIYKTAAFSY